MRATTPLKAMLVEDHAAFRQALAFVLKSEQEMEVIAQVGSLTAAREALEGGALRERLDVAVIDPVLPHGDGTDLISELRRSSPGIKVMVLSADLRPWRIDELLRAGVDAVPDKVQSPRQIAREVRREAGEALPTARRHRSAWASRPCSGDAHARRPYRYCPWAADSTTPVLVVPASLPPEPEGPPGAGDEAEGVAQEGPGARGSDAQGPEATGSDARASGAADADAVADSRKADAGVDANVEADADAAEASRAAKLGILAAHPTRRPGIFDHAVGEGEERAAPAAREPPRPAVGARQVPVPLAPQEEDELPASAARERQAPRYLHIAYAHRPPLIFSRLRYPPRAYPRPRCRRKAKRL